MSIISASFGQQASSEIAKESFRSEDAILDPRVVSREASGEAIARLTGETGSLVEEYENHYLDAENSILMNGVEDLRLRRATRNRTSRLMGAAAIPQDALANAVAAGIAAESPIISGEREVRDNLAAVRASTAGEEEYEALALAFEGDHADAALAQMEAEVREAALFTIAAEAGVYEPVPVLNTVSDFGQYLIPGWSGSTRGGVMDVEHTPLLSETIFSGKRLQTEVEAFRALPQDEQIARFEEIVQDIKDRGSLWGWENQAIIRENINAYIFGITNTDAGITSALDALDVLPTAYGLARGTANIPKLLKAVKAKKASVELVAEAYRKALAGEETPLGLSKEEVVDEILPEALSASRQAPEEVGSGLSAQQAVEAQDNAIIQMRMQADVSAATESQLREIAETTEKAFNAHLSRGQKLQDVRVVNITDKSGVSTPVLRGVIGKTDGAGYVRHSDLKRTLHRVGIDPDGVKVIKQEAFGPPAPKKVAAAKTTKYTASPGKDPDIIQARDLVLRGETDLIPEDVLFNAGKEEVTHRLLEWGGAKFLATSDGGVIWHPAALEHSAVAKDLGIKNYGRGFHHEFDFKNPLDSVDGLPGPKDSDPKFHLAKAKAAPLTPEQVKLSRGVEAARERMTNASRELADLEATQADNFLRTQVGTVEVAKRLEVARRAAVKAKSDLDDAQVALHDAKGTKVELVQKNDGTYYAEVELPLRTDGTYAPFEKDAASQFTMVSRMLFSGRAIGDLKLMDLAVLSENSRNTYIDIFKEYIKPRFNALKAKEKKLLRDLSEVMRQETRWMTDDEIVKEFTERFGATARQERFQEAYRAYRLGSDMEWYVRNSVEVNRLNARGFQTVRIDAEDFAIEPTNAFVHRDLPTSLPDGRIYDSVSGQSVAYNPSELGAHGRYVVTLDADTPVTLVSGEQVWVKHIVADPQAVRAQPLKRNQMNYLEGGSHVDYDSSIRVFAKQAQVRVQGDNPNERVMMAPHTYAGGRKPSDLDDFVNAMNDAAEVARKMLAGNLTRRGAKTKIKRLLADGPADLPTADEFLNRVDNFQNGNFKEPVFDPYEPIEIVGDRRLPSAYGANSPLATEHSGHTSFLETQGRMYHSRRGNRLTDGNGTELPVLDPFKAMDKSLTNVAKMGGLAAYRQRLAGQFLSTWGSMLRLPQTHQTDPEMLLRKLYDEHMWGASKVWGDMTPQQITRAKNELAVAGRALAWKTPLQRNLDQGWIDFLNTMDRNPSQLVGFRNLINDSAHWVNRTDYGYGIRQATFDAFLGMGNIAQVTLQISTALAHTAVDPVGAARALEMSPFTAAYLRGLGNADSLRSWILPRRQLLGMSPADGCPA